MAIKKVAFLPPSPSRGCETGIQAQTFAKGSVPGLHDAPVTLCPGVTMDQYINFTKTKLFPAYEKNVPGLKCYLLKGKRGQCTDCYAMLMVFTSEAARDKIWKPDNT